MSTSSGSDSLDGRQMLSFCPRPPRKFAKTLSSSQIQPCLLEMDNHMNQKQNLDPNTNE